MTEHSLVGETALIVRAFVTHNPVRADDLPKLISDTHAALQALQKPPAPVVEPRPEPAVPVRKSVQPDKIICLECGLSFKSIKRHLGNQHGHPLPPPHACRAVPLARLRSPGIVAQVRSPEWKRPAAASGANASAGGMIPLTLPPDR